MDNGNVIDRAKLFFSGHRLLKWIYIVIPAVAIAAALLVSLIHIATPIGEYLREFDARTGTLTSETVLFTVGTILYCVHRILVTVAMILFLYKLWNRKKYKATVGELVLYALPFILILAADLLFGGVGLYWKMPLAAVYRTYIQIAETCGMNIQGVFVR